MDYLTMTAEQTMSSREIAELTGTRADNVKRTMERLKEQELITFTQSEEKGTGGRPGTQYHVGKRDSFVVVARLSPEFTAALVDRWQELESNQLPDFSNPAAAARAWAEQYEKRIQAEQDAAALKLALDREFGYCSIIRAALFAQVHESYFNWRPLKAMTLKLGLAVKRVPSPRFAYQNLYPLRAFEAVYPEIDFDDLKPEFVDDPQTLALGAGEKA